MIDEQYTDGSHNWVTPTFTLRTLLVIKPKLAGLCADSTEKICVGDLA